MSSSSQKPNVLFVMTDQQRFDTIGALGNSVVSTPNIDRLVRRGVSFGNAYSTSPVCVAARYTMMSGSEPTRTDVYDNSTPDAVHEKIREVCGPYLAESMNALGYRTFGVGKFHTTPWDAPLGFERQLYSEELYFTEEQRAGDDYAAHISTEHPEFDWVENLMGERTEMYYMPQMSPFPAELTVEHWATERTLELLSVEDTRPWFGIVSYIGPHPPFAPPVPFNRMYDPDLMPDPVVGELAVDHLDQQIPWMNYMVFAEEMDGIRARSLKARYYGEISYIDGCIGRLLDHVEDLPDADNTVICFFADHGDLLGDHHGWQKESFFEASTRVPFLMSWPARLPADVLDDSLVCITDLYGIATTAGGGQELRQGADVLGALTGEKEARETLFGYHGRPGTPRFKAMVRTGDLKLIWMANGDKTLLFDVKADAEEHKPLDEELPDVVRELRAALVRQLRAEGIDDAFDGEGLKTFDYASRPLERLYQFDVSRGIEHFINGPAVS